MTAKAHLAKAANPAPAPPRGRSLQLPRPSRRSRTKGCWIKGGRRDRCCDRRGPGCSSASVPWPQPAAREEQAIQVTSVAENATAAERGATPPDIRSAAKVVAEKRASAIAPSKAAALPKPTTAAGRRLAARQKSSSDQHVAPAPVVAPARTPETPAPVPTKAPALVAGSPAPPTGRFFERNDVDVPPQIATRVEPKLPANLPARPDNDVVVVRVLVLEHRSSVPRQSASWVQARSLIGRGGRRGGHAVDVLASEETGRVRELLVQHRRPARQSELAFLPDLRFVGVCCPGFTSSTCFRDQPASEESSSIIERRRPHSGSAIITAHRS